MCIPAEMKNIHVCYGAPGWPAIELQCEEGEVIVVEEAVVGWNSDYKPGTIHCPRDTEECTAQFDLLVHRCHGQQQCSVSNTEIYTDLYRPHQCDGTTNYLDGSYLCLPGE